MRWLGYRNLFSYGQALIDLDAAPPSDLAEIMQQHTGIAAHAIEDHRLVGTATLPVRLRPAFCSKCWMEEGPYRRREWASGWTLTCTRHRSLLREKAPLTPPVPRDAEDSWLEYYETPRLWREVSPSWASERWVAICDALGVNPRTEFARAYSGCAIFSTSRNRSWSLPTPPTSAATLQGGGQRAGPSPAVTRIGPRWAETSGVCSGISCSTGC